jgi:antitoxin (DNA-binding transcriptional repressor) of toxin-antitoxin stability system
MDRISVADAERDFAGLIARVYSEGISVELQRGDQVIARITPAAPQSPLKVRDLNAFLQSLPKLGDDAEMFLEDLRAIRRGIPTETDPWA